jgi:Uma2 family endonuclease
MATIQLPQLEVFTEPRPHRWTRTEYCRMAEAGLFDGRRVELIDGEVLDMPAQKNFHMAAITLLHDALRPVFGEGHWIRIQGSLDLNPTSVPDPDIAVVPGSPRGCSDKNPTTALLIIEVSDTTLAYDRGRKASLYAQAGIADYWIVNLIDRQLEVYRDPAADSSKPYGFGYGSRAILTATEVVAPLAAPQARIGVADMLP